MKNNRIIVLLAKLNKKEFGRFLKYVESPFFNQNVKLTKLSHYLGKHFPAFPPEKLQKEVLFKALYGSTAPCEDQKIHDHLSQLLKLLEGFLAQEEFKEDKISQELFLLDGLRKKGMDKQFQRGYKRLEDRLDKIENQNSTFFLNQLRMQESKAEFDDYRQKRGKHHNFFEILTSLKSYYLGASIQYACEIINRSGIAKSDTERNRLLVNEIKQQLETKDSPYLKIPNISIYYKILLTLQEPEETRHYEDLKELLSTYASVFSKSEAKVLYAYAQNYCIRQVNRGNIKFYEELFELFKGLLKRELLHTNSDEFPHEHYKNITTIGLMLKEYDWVYDFLEEYKSKLHDSVRENAHSYNLANYYYETDQHTKAMRLLQQVEFTDVYYNVSARATLIKIFFDARDFDSIKYVSQAFQAYLKRNKAIPNLYYNRHSNFLLIIRKLARVYHKRHRLSREEFSEEMSRIDQSLQELKEVSFRSWIKSQIKHMDEVMA